MERYAVKLENHILGILLDDINHNRLALPMLPEIALQTRQVVEHPDSSAADIAAIISTDAVISARLLQVANSPLYRSSKPIDSVKYAVARLGNTVVRNIVTSLVLEQLYQTERDPWLDQHLRTLWQHSIRVAAISHVLAHRYTRLSADQALLAGLIHDIGAIPLYSKVATLPELREDDALLRQVILKLHTLAGTAILDEWNFPQALIDVVTMHEHLDTDNVDDPVDYVDLVAIANAFDHSRTEWPEQYVQKKLGVSPEELAEIVKQGGQEVEAIERTFAAR